MMTERLKNLLKVLIFAFLASGVALALLLQIQSYHRLQIYLATEAVMPQHKPNGELRLYKNELVGYSFVYPSKLSLLTTGGTVELSHQIPYKNTGECNMKGDEEIFDYLADFRVSIFIANGSVSQVVKQLSPYMPEENFVAETLKVSPGFIDSYQANNLTGFSIYEGAEGCGQVVYYLPLADKKVLVVKRNMVQLLSSAVLPEINQNVLATPGVINPGQADLIFNQLLKSFQYHPQNALSNSIELDSANWKTYKNDQYGFEFMYPQEWSVPVLKNEVVELGCPKEDYEGELKCPLTFSILAPTPKTEFIKSLDLTPFKYGEKLVNWNGPEIEYLNFDGFDAISYRSVGMCNYSNSVYFGKKMNVHFQDNCEKYLTNGQYKQIVNTFKFTK